MKIALVYDRVNKYGGAERVLEALHQIWPQAPLYTSVYDPSTTSWTKDWDIRPSWLNRLPLANRNHEFLAPLMPYVFESLDLSQFNVVITLTSAEAKGIITRPDQLHVCYLLTPTRYLWSHHTHYQGHGFSKFLTLPFISSLRRWDYLAARRPDHTIPISNHVASRTNKYYQVNSNQVIYPPVDTSIFDQHNTSCTPKYSNYHLLVSRLVSYKNIEIAVESFNQQGSQLIIVGQGRQGASLKRLAKSNIRFIDQVSDEKLSCLLNHANALIFPQEEDFGITAVESQAAGTPVIAYNRGGARETIIHHKTGIFFDELMPESLTKAVKTSQTIKWDRQTIQHHAEKFDIKRFQHTFQNTIEELWQKHPK